MVVPIIGRTNSTGRWAEAYDVAKINAATSSAILLGKFIVLSFSSFRLLFYATDDTKKGLVFLDKSSLVELLIEISNPFINDYKRVILFIKWIEAVY